MSLTDTIDGNLDGQHIRIVHCFLHQLQQNPEIIIRIFQQHILPLDQLQQAVLRFQMELFITGNRLIRSVVHILPHGFRQVVSHAVHIVQSQRRSGGKYLGSADLVAVNEILRNQGLAPAPDFHPDRGEVLALSQSLLHCLQIIPCLHFFFLKVDVSTPGNSKNSLVHHRVAHKNLVDEFLDNILQKDELRLFLAEINHPVQHLRQGNDAQNQLFLALQHRRNIQFLVVQVRKRMMLVNNLRRQHRQNALLEHILQASILLLGQLVDIGMADALFQKLAAEIGKYPVTLAIQLPYRIKYGIQLLPCRHEALVVHLLGIHGLQAQEATYSHHKELIQVAGEYLHEFQPFAQRHAAVLCLLQHALVKFQPGQLPVLSVAGYKFLAILCTWL